MKPISAFALMLGALLSCGESPSSNEAPDPLAPPPFPQASATAVIYIRTDTLDAHGSASRYVLNADSSFVLQFTSVRFGVQEYAGKYSRADTTVALDFRDPTVLGRWEWEASAILRGDSLRVRYNFTMGMTDFVDGVYVKSR